jgi:predicted nucleotidyltransferase
VNLTALRTVIQALHDAQVRYLIAGGLAVNVHGYIRVTMDIDLVIALDANNIQSAFKALANIGYRPTVPVTASGFSKPEQREQWREEKEMKVLNFFCDQYPMTTVDVFVYEPFDFSKEYDNALKAEFLPGLEARIVSIPTLIEMKQAAGRNRDIDDIQHLKWIQENESGE